MWSSRNRHIWADPVNPAPVLTAIAPARSARGTLRQALNKVEKLSEGRSIWFKVTRSLDDIKRLARDWDDWDQAIYDAAKLVTQMDDKRDRLGVL